jgi:hypothetical protein
MLVAATCSCRGCPGLSWTLRRQTEDLAAQRGQPAAPGGQRDPAPIADEQLVAELLPEGGNRHRHRRLGDLELGRRGLDRPEPSDENERLQLGEGHLGLGVTGTGSTITSVQTWPSLS